MQMHIYKKSAEALLLYSFRQFFYINVYFLSLVTISFALRTFLSDVSSSSIKHQTQGNNPLRLIKCLPKSNKQ